MRRLSHFGSFHQLYASQGPREIYRFAIQTFCSTLFNAPLNLRDWQRCYFCRFRSPKHHGKWQCRQGPPCFTESSGCLGGFRSLAHPRGRCRGPLGDPTHLEVSTTYEGYSKFTIKIVACLACPNTFSKVPS